VAGRDSFSGRLVARMTHVTTRLGVAGPEVSRIGNLALVEQLRSVAEGRGAAVAQIAIAWLLARGEDIVPLIGARTLVHDQIGTEPGDRVGQRNRASAQRCRAMKNIVTSTIRSMTAPVAPRRLNSAS
jgi:hypothetical protein